MKTLKQWWAKLFGPKPDPDFEIDGNAVNHEIYRRHLIEIFLDESPRCPWDNEDCLPPLYVYNGDGYTQYGNDSDVQNVPYLSEKQILDNQKTICDITDHARLKDLADAYSDAGDTLEDRVREGLIEAVDDMSGQDQLSTLADLWNITGVPAVCRRIRGYSQGDWAYVLAVATPELQKECGNAPGYWQDLKHLEARIKLFADWAYGNVYGYNIVDPSGEDVDGCWGFYGDIDEKGGLLDETRAEIDGIIARKTLTSRMKRQWDKWRYRWTNPLRK